MSVLKDLIKADSSLGLSKKGVNAYVDTDEYETDPKARKELGKRLSVVFNQIDGLAFLCGTIANVLDSDHLKNGARVLNDYLDNKGNYTQDDAVDALTEFRGAFEVITNNYSAFSAGLKAINDLKGIKKEIDAIYKAL